MGYKITKYKGKTKLKDTKSGKSVEIDIDQLMNGGQKKDLYKYVLGGEECPPGDVECEKLKAMQAQSYGDQTGNPLNSMSNTEGRAQSGITAYNQNNGVGSLPIIDQNQDPQGGTAKAASFMDYDSILQNKNLASTENKSLGELSFNTDSNEEVMQKSDEEENYQLANPYGTVDLAGASTLLGQGIQSGDGNLTALAGTKLGIGLTRNFMSGASNANKFNRIAEKTKEDQIKGLKAYKENGGSLQNFAYGGKKDEELATGDYIRGLDNRAGQQPNAEVEQGEYLQDGQGQVAQVVGKKHSKGGEEIEMDQEDKVLSDKMKIGKDASKYLADKYDIKLKAKDTYSTVLDRLRTKLKLKKVTDKEADIIKKIDNQQDVTDDATRDLNLQVLAENKKEVETEKAPLKQMESEAFNELYDMQEYSKKKDNPEPEQQQNLEDGGMLSSLAQEYGIPIERAQELIQEFSKGGKLPEYACGGGKVKNSKGECVPEKELTREEAMALAKVREGQSKEGKFYGKIDKNLYDRAVNSNEWYFKDHPDFDPSNEEDVKDYQKSYNEIAKKYGANEVTVDGKWGEQTNSIDVNQFYKTNEPYVEPPKDEVKSYLNSLTFPDQYPLPPSQLQGTIKPDRNYDRVTPNQIEIDPYLRDIRNREQSQMRSMEGLSPNVGMAAQNNMRASSNRAEADIRNKVDLQNLQTREKAEYENNRIANREEDMNWRDRLLFEQRAYRAESNTRNDWNNYYNNLQDINTQRFKDVRNLNLINASDENMYFDGQNFRRKKGAKDEDFYKQILNSKGLSEK